jgi:two-component system, NarL family, response regulator LiaR
MASELRVLSIDSNDQSRSALQALLSGISGLTDAAQAANSAQAMQALAVKSVDVALVDLGSPDSIELTKRVRKSYPSVRLVIITASDSPDDIFAAMDAGADGYVLKGNVEKALEIAIRSVKLNTVWLDPAIAQQVLQAIENSAEKQGRILPTGLVTLPLLPDEKSLLHEVAASSCKDGVCMVDPSFVRKLKRFAPKD